MRQGKRPTVRQKKLIKGFNINPDEWLVITENNEQITIVNRATKDVKVVSK